MRHPNFEEARVEGLTLEGKVKRLIEDLENSEPCKVSTKLVAELIKKRLLDD